MFLCLTVEKVRSLGGENWGLRQGVRECCHRLYVEISGVSLERGR